MSSIPFDDFKPVGSSARSTESTDSSTRPLTKESNNDINASTEISREEDFDVDLSKI